MRNIYLPSEIWEEICSMVYDYDLLKTNWKELSNTNDFHYLERDELERIFPFSVEGKLERFECLSNIYNVYLEISRLFRLTKRLRLFEKKKSHIVKSREFDEIKSLSIEQHNESVKVIVSFILNRSLKYNSEWVDVMKMINKYIQNSKYKDMWEKIKERYDYAF